MKPPQRRDGGRPRPGGPSRPQGASPDPARLAAAHLVRLVLDERRTLDDAMERDPGYARLDGRDRTFAAHVALGTLRALAPVDRALASRMARPLPASAGLARAILRTGAAQILDGLAPAHAAVSRSVAVAKAEMAARGFSGLMNAVLRRLSEGAGPIRPRDRVPDAWANRWRLAHGDAAIDLIGTAMAEQPALDLTVLDDPAGWLAEAEAAGLNAQVIDTGPGPGGTIRLAAGQSIAVGALPGWAQGRLIVQDAAASLPARLLGARSRERVLDACAAPGGKTAQLAATGADVTSVDVDAARLDKVSETLARTGLKAKLVAGDARDVMDSEPGGFDAILLDAPCSATGTLRRNPETLWIKSPADAARLSGLQAQLVQAAARALKPGGRLVYAVCSLEPEEADAALAAAKGAGLLPDPVAAAEIGSLKGFLTADGHVRTLPGDQDGFFIARFRKAG